MSLLQTFTNVVLYIRQKIDAQNISVYEQKQNRRILTNLQFIDGSIQDDKKLMEHPKEDGTMIVDHMIDDPIQVSLEVLISDNDSSSLSEIQDLYTSATPVIIKVKNELHTNLVMASKPLKVDTNHFDKTVYNLTFKEIQEAITVYVKMSVPQVKQKANASKIKTGHKQAQANTSKPSILRKIYNKVTGK